MVGAAEKQMHAKLVFSKRISCATTIKREK
jgi:hypothetical protein